MTQIIKSNQITNKYYLLALTNFEKKDFKLAKFHFLEYLKKNDDFKALNLLGICYLNLKEYIAAAKVFKELISKKIITDSILNNYGVALKNLKEFNTAKYYFKKSIKVNQKNFLALFNLGNLNFEINKETEAEILQTMDDLRAVDCDVLTLGQYLQPTKKHLPVADFITPATFERYKEIGLEKGFKFVESGPLVRSSYHAERHVG